MANAPLGAPQVRCAWHAKEDLSLVLRGTRTTCSTSASLRVAGAALGAPPHSNMDAGCFCVTRAALAASVSFCVAGATLTCSTSMVGGSPATSECYGRRMLWHGMCTTWSTSASFSVASAAALASHLEHLRLVARRMRSTCSTCSTSIEVGGSPATSEYYGRRLLVRGRCSTWSTSGSFGVARAALGAPS